MPVEDVTSTLPMQVPLGTGTNTVQAHNADASSLFSGLLGDKYVYRII